MASIHRYPTKMRIYKIRLCWMRHVTPLVVLLMLSAPLGYAQGTPVGGNSFCFCLSCLVVLKVLFLNFPQESMRDTVLECDGRVSASATFQGRAQECALVS